jgi:hypothetical protein
MSKVLGTKVNAREILGPRQTREFVAGVFGEDLHAARVASLANGVTGVLNTAVLSIHAIGQAYAQVAEITPKSGVKQIDRLLGNEGVALDTVMKSWVRFVVGETKAIIVALDWTDFDDDDHTTLAAYLVTSHGRATPLAWKTVKKTELKTQRTKLEQDMIERLEDWIPTTVGVTLLADRGFGSQVHYKLLSALSWDYVIRFRGAIQVESDKGERRTAKEWLGPSGRAVMLPNALVTQDRTEVGAVVAVKAAGMKDAWFLATSLSNQKAADIIKLYGRRFTIEETFRDTKDLHFGMGLSATHIKSVARRDRLLLLVAMAHSLLTLLGAASEESGLDRILKVNTVKRRTHSLFRQGCYWYGCLPTMREEWLRSLVQAFDRIVRGYAFYAEIFAVE